MSENWNPNTEQDNVEQPLDFWAQVREKEALEKAQKEVIKKADQEAAAKSDREKRLATQLARSATKREEIAKKAETIEEKIEASKAHVKEAEKVLKDESNKMPEAELPKPIVIENFGSQSRWEDDLTMKNTDVTLQFTHEVESTKATILEAEATAADARAEAARDTLSHISQAEVDTQNPGRIEKFSSVNDLGVDSDILRNQVRNAWEHAPSASTVPDVEVEAIGAIRGSAADRLVETSSSMAVPSTEHATAYAGDSAQSYTAPTMAPENATGNTFYGNDPVSSAPVVKGSLFKPVVAIADGLLASSISGLRRAMGKSSNELKSNASALRTDIDAVRASKNLSQSPPQTPSYDAFVGGTHEYIVPLAPVAPSPTRESVDGFNSMPEIKNSYPDIPNNQGSVIPGWIRQIEKDVKNGKIVELKNWQRDVLRIQHPKLLEKYEQLDKSITEKLRVASPESQPRVDIPDALPRTITLAGELPAPVSPTAQSAPRVAYKMPVFVPNTPMSPYQYAMSGNTAVFSMGDYLTKVLVFGAVFGAVLIVFFG